MTRAFFILAALPVVGGANLWATSYTSVPGTGLNWSASSTWSPSGVPGDGDSATIVSGVVLDTNAGSFGGAGIGNIIISGPSASLTTDGLAPHFIWFASTGSDPVGAGSEAAPADCPSSATMCGIFMTQGILDTSAATAANCVVIAAANSTAQPTCSNTSAQVDAGFGGSPVYISCNNQVSGPCTINLESVVLVNAGTADSKGFQGIDVNDTTYGSSGLTIDHSLFPGVWQIKTGNLAACSVTSSSFTGAASGYVFWQFLGTSTPCTFNDNTAWDPVANAQFTNLMVGSGDGLTALRNAGIGNATWAMGLFSELAGSGQGATIVQYNLDLGGNGGNTAYPGSAGIFIPGGTGTVVIANNLIQNINQGIVVSSANRSISDVTTVTGNIVVGNSTTNSQASIMTYNGQNNSSYNILPWDSVPPVGNAQSIMAYNSSSVAGTTGLDAEHNTGIGTSNSDTLEMIMVGDSIDNSTSALTVGTIIKNNLAYSGQYAMENSAPNIYMKDFNGVGVHHNTSAGSNAYLVAVPGENFSDGTHDHPSAVYGDSQTDPVFVDPTRRAESYDAWIGGPGTAADLAAGLAARCGLLGPWNPVYDPVRIYNWVRAGFTPTNAAINGLADDGAYTGAVRPILVGARLP